MMSINTLRACLDYFIEKRTICRLKLNTFYGADVKYDSEKIIKVETLVKEISVLNMMIRHLNDELEHAEFERKLP